MLNESDNRIRLHKGHLKVDWIAVKIQSLQKEWPQAKETGWSKISKQIGQVNSWRWLGFIIILF